MKSVSIIIPYHKRENSENVLLNYVIPALYFQDEYSLLGTPRDKLFMDSFKEDAVAESSCFHCVREVTFIQLLVVKDEAVRPDTQNCCVKINVGLRQAKGEVFILLLQDIMVKTNAIKNIVEHILTNPDDMVYGNVYKEDFFNDPNPLYWGGEKRPNEFWGFVACNRQKVIDLGGIDEDFFAYYGWEDVLMLEYWKKNFNLFYSDKYQAVHKWHGPPPGEIIGGINGKLCADALKNPDYRPNKNNPDWGKLWISKTD
jgi:glycosyltransferase involved in cell wall biosynthesis